MGKDDVTKNQLPELTGVLKSKMQRCMDYNNEDMEFWHVVFALQCTKIYVKYHMNDVENLNELKKEYESYPIISFPLLIVLQLSPARSIGATFAERLNKLFCNDFFIRELLVEHFL